MNCERFRSLITDYLEGVLSSSDARGINEHRIDCDGCETFLSEIKLTIEALGGLNRGSHVDPMRPELLSAFRMWSNSEEKVNLSRKVKNLSTVLDLSEFERESAIAGLEHDDAVTLGLLAVEEASRLSVRDPSRAIEVAGLAVEVLKNATQNLQLHRASENDHLVRAWSILGNCRRICSDFPGAAQAFKEAKRALDRGTGELAQRALFYQIRAQYFADRGRFADSTDDLDKAIGVYRETGDKHNEGRTLIGKAKVLGSFGELEEAIPLLVQGLELIDPQQDRRLELVGKHNLVQYLAESGSWKEAFKLLPETRRLHQELGNPVDLIRFQWLEGKIALDLEDLGVAESAFVEAKRYFVEKGMAYDAALVSLDLAMVFLKQARIAELKVLAAEMVTIFRALGIPREVLAALAFFNRALEIEQTATVGLLQELLETLEKTRQREECRPQLGVSN